MGFERDQHEQIRKEHAGREQEDFQGMEQFRKKTEELFQPLDGMPAGVLEQQVLEHVKGVLADYGEAAEAAASAVTGSRCRGLEQDDSDVDVVVEVRGEGMREKTLLEMLKGDWVTVGGVRVDIHPIVPGQTGTLAEYLKGEEERLAARHPEYKPLAKVEELEEQNYNMIDNQLNNAKPKEKQGLSGLRYSNFQIEKRVEDDGYRLIADVRFEGSGTVRPEQVVGEFKNREEIIAYCDRNHLEYMDITNYLQNRIAKKQQRTREKDPSGRQGHEREIGGGQT